MRFVPKNGNIVVVKTGRASVTPGGIHLPETAVKESESAVVVATSDPWTDEHGVERRTQFEPLQVVLISKYSGEGFTVGDRTFSVLKESAVLCHLPDFVTPNNGPLPTIDRAAPARAVLFGTEQDHQAVSIDDVGPSAVVPADDPRLGPLAAGGSHEPGRPLTPAEAARAKAELLASMGHRG